MVRINKHFIRYILIIPLIFGLIISSASCSKQEKTIAPKEKVTIGVASLILSIPIIIAQEKGYFSDAGLDVTFKPFPFGKPAMEAMFRGEVDISTVAETPVVFSSFIRDDYVIFVTFVSSYDDSKMLVRKDRGITKPADLKGRKIGMTAGTSSHFFTHIYLSENRIDLSSVTLMSFPAPCLPEALQAGKVDAIAVFEPYGYMAKKAMSDKVTRLPRTELFRETFNLLTMKRYAQEHPETLKRILGAVDKAIVFIKQNKSEAIGIMSKGSLKLEEELLKSVWDDFNFNLTLDNGLLTTIEDEARWAMKNRLTDKTKTPNYLDYFYLDAMKAVKPESVRIVK